jgi:phage protein D
MAPPQSTYIPDFDLALSGVPLPAELRAAITSVRFDESIEGSDRVEIELADPTMALQAHPLLELSARLDLQLGYRPDALAHVFAGEISGVEPAFPSGGMPSVSISAQDLSSRLSRGTKTRGFPYELTDSVIATIVAAEHGLVALPDAAAAAASALALLEERPRYQFKQSDHDFLRALAAEWGFDMWVDGDLLNFRRLVRELPPPEVELRWGESLVDFAPRLSSIGQVAAVSVGVWVESLSTQLQATVSFDGERLSFSVAPTTFAAAGEDTASLSLPDVPLDSPLDAVRWALSELRRRVNGRVTARGSAVGDPRLRVGSTLAIAGVGPRFSGSSYRITSSSHSLDGGGYRTSFELRQEVV